MFNFLYITITSSIIVTSLISLIVLILIIIIKRNFRKFYILLFVFFLAGLYLYIPHHLICKGIFKKNNDALILAEKLSVNPYEKKLCNIHLAYRLFNIEKNGPKAIEHYEKAFNGEYAKYKPEALNLIYLYSIKTDYKKALELCKIVDSKCSLPLRNYYIQNKEYEKALTTFKKAKGEEELLKADLYKQIGDYKNEQFAREEAKQYIKFATDIMSESDKETYFKNAEKYQSVDNYEKWILERKKEYKF